MIKQILLHDLLTDDRQKPLFTGQINHRLATSTSIVVHLLLQITTDHTGRNATPHHTQRSQDKPHRQVHATQATNAIITNYSALYSNHNTMAAPKLPQPKCSNEQNRSTVFTA